VALCLAAVAVGPTQASANTGKDNSGSTNTTTDSGGQGTSYHVRVSYTHRGAGRGAVAATSSDEGFAPPVCWYTSFTPDQFKDEIDRRYVAAGQEGADTVSDYYNEVQSDMTAIKYHKGDKGSWWVLTWDDAQLNRPDATCPYTEGWMWEPPAKAPAGAITPAVLAQAAYGQLTLPKEGVALSPAAANQKVNLPTYVRLRQAHAQVSVTAQLTEPGGEVVAATVVAQPYRLRVDAGTQYASPGSCTYDVPAGAKGGALDTAHAECNITYTKASSGTYPFTAATTWRVWWTPTADVQPDGTALPDGLSQDEQDVTVQEIQSVNR
jgi:enoyl reductase